MSVVVRPLDKENIDEIAAIHRAAFRESAWTRLGGRVVEEYYLWHLLGPHPIVRATGAFLGDRCAGFCVSGVFSRSTSGFLAKNRNLLVARLVMKPWLILDPVFFGKLKSGKKILKRFNAIKTATVHSTTPKRAESFGILAIAVDPACQGLGIGQVLMDDAEKAAVENKFLKMDLTVNPQNGGAIRFYEKLNWTKSQQNGAWKGLMIKEVGVSSRG